MEDLNILPDAGEQEEKAVLEMTERIESRLNVPIQKAGAATSQEEYEKYYDLVFAELDQLNAELASKPYLTGDVVTKADAGLFSILIRFDVIYFFAYRLNRNHIKDFPNLWSYLRRLYSQERFAKAADIEKIKKEYYLGLDDVHNPYHLVADGPDISLS